MDKGGLFKVICDSRSRRKYRLDKIYDPGRKNFDPVSLQEEQFCETFKHFKFCYNSSNLEDVFALPCGSFYYSLLSYVNLISVLTSALIFKPFSCSHTIIAVN